MEIRGQGEARAGALQDQSLDGDPEAESDFLRDEVDQRIDDAYTGKIKLTRYYSAEEYLRYLDKVLAE